MGFWDMMKDAVREGLEDAKKKQENERHKESAELGYQLLMSTWNEFFPVNSKYSSRVSQIKRELCNKRSDLLVRAAELVGEPITAKELYTVSHAYLDAGASFRNKAIEYLEKYISVGACWEETPAGTQNDLGVKRDLRNTAIANVHISLGKLYEAEYRFDEAMEQYRTAFELCPYDADGIVGMSGIYIKTGDYDGGIKMFKDVLKSKYYRVYIYRGIENTGFVSSVDHAYNNLLEKQQTGYVYRPRKKKATQSLIDT